MATSAELQKQLDSVRTEAQAIKALILAIGPNGCKRDDMPAGKLTRAALRVLEQNGYIWNEGVGTGSITLILTEKGKKFYRAMKKFGRLV